MLGSSEVEERVPTAGVFIFSRPDKHNDKSNSHLNNFMQRSEINKIWIYIICLNYEFLFLGIIIKFKLEILNASHGSNIIL